MSMYPDFLEGTFNGVVFSVPSEDTTKGKKTVMHEYPNSDIRYIEDQGKIPPIFTLKMSVHGADSITQRLKLEIELDKEGTGRLVHPVYGLIRVSVIDKYSINYSENRLGEFIFTVTFAVTSEKPIQAYASTVDTSQISQNAKDLKDKIDEAIEDKWAIPDFSKTFDDVSNKITSVTESINGAIKEVISPIQANVDALTKVTNSIENSVYTIVSNGTILKDTLTNLYDSVLDIVELPENLAGMWEALIDFGDDTEYSTDSGLDSDTAKILDYKTDTPQRLENSTNSKLINEHTQLTALAFTPLKTSLMTRLST